MLQTSTRAYLIGKAAGEANIIFIDKDGRQVATLEVTVERDLTGLATSSIASFAGANIQRPDRQRQRHSHGHRQNPIDATRAGEIATQVIGVDPKLRPRPPPSSVRVCASMAARRPAANRHRRHRGRAVLINMLTVEGREQVLLKVSVVEMERNILKQFGVDLNALINSGNFAFAALSDLPFPINVAGKGLLAPFLKGTEDGATNAFPIAEPPTFLRWSIPAVSAGNGRPAAAACKACSGRSRRTASLHTLAEPNLTAISGETANFLAGGEFPIPVAQQLGTISVEFKKFGIGLAFTPVVMSEGRISLKVSTEVSELSNQGAVVLSNIAIPGAEGAPRRDRRSSCRAAARW